VLENVIAPGDGPPPAGMERFFDAWAASAPGPQAVVAAGERAGIRVGGPPLRGAGTAG
jgi:hypothetical protein